MYPKFYVVYNDSLTIKPTNNNKLSLDFFSTNSKLILICRGRWGWKGSESIQAKGENDIILKIKNMQKVFNIH